MHLIDMGCEYVFVTGTPDDVQNIANTPVQRIRPGPARQLARACPVAFSGAGSTLSATVAAMLANGAGCAGSGARSAGIHVAALAHAGRIGMGKLIPDRLFWAREPDDPA